LYKNLTKSIYKKKKIKTIIIGFIFFIILIFNVNFFNQSLHINNFINDDSEYFRDYNDNLESANGETILFEGIGSPLNINDTGILYNMNQEISVSNEEELNLSYYLDETNNWKVDRIETSINNLQDTRNWVNNSGFQPVQIFRVNQIFESAHDYSNNNDPYTDIDYTITETGAYYMRVHFVNMSFDYQTEYADSDFMVVMNGSQNEVLSISGNRTNFYSPWSIGEDLILSFR